MEQWAEPKTSLGEQTHFLTLGMPSLGFGGLSENWLLKTCGDLHWSSICRAAGRSSREIVDRAGNRLYASFVDVLVSGSPLAEFGEADDLVIESKIRRVSRRRVWSRHRLGLADAPGLLSVEMLTIFLRRCLENGANGRLESSAPEFCLELPDYDPGNDDSELGRLQCREENSQHLPRVDFQGAARSVEYTPCPTLDFNGAKLLYFANYQQILDRAEWECFPELATESYTTTRREIKYRANIDVREKVTVTFRCNEASDSAIRHEAEMRRSSDGRTIAEVLTEKRSLAA